MTWKVIISSVFALIVIFSLMFYFLPFNVVNFESKTGNSNFSEVQSGNQMQFYPNMRFPDTEMSYKISDCPIGKKGDMEFAFEIVENLTPLRFTSVNEDEEITITCEETPKITKGLFTAGEGGPTNITKAGEFYVILNGEILLIKKSECQRPNIALHEFFHVLGFDHSNNPENIMYNFTDCDQTIGEDMVQLINELYSVPSYPDLAFENVSAVMKGRFIDINMTIKNIGLKNAGKTRVIIYADGNQIKEIDFDSLGIGYGRIITLGNIWVSQINVNELSLMIVTDFDERNKENNKIKLEIKE